MLAYMLCVFSREKKMSTIFDHMPCSVQVLACQFMPIIAKYPRLKSCSWTSDNCISYFALPVSCTGNNGPIYIYISIYVHPSILVLSSFIMLFIDYNFSYSFGLSFFQHLSTLLLCKHPSVHKDSPHINLEDNNRYESDDQPAPQDTHYAEKVQSQSSQLEGRWPE